MEQAYKDAVRRIDEFWSAETNGRIEKDEPLLAGAIDAALARVESAWRNAENADDQELARGVFQARCDELVETCRRAVGEVTK